MPTSVALMFNWSWISGMTGGTASTVRRSALPASHSNKSDVKNRSRGEAPPAVKSDVPGISTVFSYWCQGRGLT